MALTQTIALALTQLALTLTDWHPPARAAHRPASERRPSRRETQLYSRSEDRNGPAGGSLVIQ